MSTDRYSFIVTCRESGPFGIHRNLLMFYYPEDNTIELRETNRSRLFLRRIECKGITMKNIYIGADLRLFSRSVLILAYGDEYTRSTMEMIAQKTLAIIKPDAISKLGAILRTLIDNNLSITEIKMITISEDAAYTFYDHFVEKDLVKALVKHLTSGPVIIMQLIGNNAVDRMLEIIGTMDEPDSLCGRFGTGVIKDAIYASTSKEVYKKNEELFLSKRNSESIKLHLSECNNTCCIVKPTAIKKGELGKIICMIQDLGFTISGIVSQNCDRKQAEFIYDIYEKVIPEYKAMVEELSSGMSVALEITGSERLNVADEFRKAVGPFDPEVCRLIRPNTIRAKFGDTKVENAVHVSDLPVEVDHYISFFFKGYCET